MNESARPGETIGPELVRIRRVLPAAEDPVSAEDLPSVLSALPLPGSGRGGRKILIGVGSRGIAGLEELVRRTVERVRSAKAEPFIIPAMGSHGGGGFDGQREVLRSLGIQETTVGAPVIDPGRSIDLGTTTTGGVRRSLFLPEAVLDADGLVLVNRVKPHTSFDGRVGSGLSKMLSVGLGGAASARMVHGDGPQHLGSGVLGVARELVHHPRLPSFAGVAVVEDALGRWAAVEVVRGPDCVAADERLLGMADRLLARLPFSRLGLLVVERMGKDISGTGMDTHVLGRRRLPGVADPPGPSIERVLCCSLTDASHGNATGIGLADAVSSRLADAVDVDATRRNVQASGFSGRAQIPPVPGADRESVTALLGATDLESGVCVIRDTLHLGTIWASGPVVAEALEEPGAEAAGTLPGVPFTPEGEIDGAALWRDESPHA
jgi:hypothetical protein